jgi:transposase
MQAVAGALEGLTRAEAAGLAGMERQALRDAVLPYNAEGVAGLRDRPRPGRPARLDEAQRGTLHKLVLDGPDVEATGVSAWTLAELCREIEERWGVRYHQGHMSKLVRRLGLGAVQLGRPEPTAPGQRMGVQTSIVPGDGRGRKSPKSLTSHRGPAVLSAPASCRARSPSSGWKKRITGVDGVSATTRVCTRAARGAAMAARRSASVSPAPDPPR